MRPLRVCIYGGTNLQGAPLDFVAALSYELLSTLPRAVIVTGGFRHSVNRPKALSTDSAALEGATRYAEERGGNLRDYYEACMPDEDLDDLWASGGAVRMTERDRISVRRMTDRTPLGRRLAMVRDVDAVVTVSGGRHTEVVIEQAIELGLPTLPIPDRVSVSKEKRSASDKMLRKHRPRIENGFARGALAKALSVVTASIEHHPDVAARAVAELLGRARIGRCLVLMPFDESYETRYEDVIAPAVEKHMQPVRLDHLTSSEPIFRNLEAQIDHARAVVADVTEPNENVMYEVGYAHGRGLQPLLFTTEASRREDLPVYLRNRNVHLPGDDVSLHRLIVDHLDAAKQPRS